MAGPVRLVDRFGSPIWSGGTSGNFFQGATRTGDTRTPNGAVDTTRLLPPARWRDILSTGRFLFANVPILRGAILEQANFSGPLSLHYGGKDRDWGKIAEEFLYFRQRNASVAGPLYTSSVIQRLRLIGRKVDGDIGTLLIDDGSGFSKTQLIRAHRIGDRGGFGCEVKEGPYKGMVSCNGCVLDGYGRTVAYRVLGATAEEDQWISSNDLFLTYRPDYPDFYRGISELCACIRSFADIKRLREYEMRAQQLTAAIALIEKNDSGYAEQDGYASPAPAATGETGIETQTFEDGLIKFYRSRSGNGLEAFRSDRPSADAQSWEKQFIRHAFYGIEWDPDFALCLEMPGGAWVRAKMQKIRRAIANNVQIEAHSQEIEAGFHIAKGIEAGLLPMPKDGNWYSWNAYLSIPLPTADSGNEEAAAREAYKLGLITKQQLVAERGGWLTDVNEARKLESAEVALMARELAVDFPEMSFKEWMFWLEQREANSKTESSPDGPQKGGKKEDKADPDKSTEDTEQ